MGKKVLIIGAGIAGLAAGCYAQMNGYETEIFEMHTQPGGLCTAWERKGYTFDGCLHYLFGTAPGQAFYKLWQELGLGQRLHTHHHAAMMHIRDLHGRELVAYADPQRFADHLKALSAADASLVDDLAEGIELFTRFDMSVLQDKPKAIMSLDDWRHFGDKMTPYLLPLARWGMVSAEDLGERFQDPFLQRAVPQMFSWPDIPVMAGLMLLAYLHTGNAGFPYGGSLAFSRLLEQRYLELGGQIHYKSQVEKILVEEDCAKGLRLYNDEIHYADAVVSAADGRATIFDMLEGKFTNRKLRKLYNGRMPMYALIQVSLGLKRDLSAEPHWATYLLDEPLLVAGEQLEEIDIKQYGFDPSLAPQGHSSMVVKLRSNYAYWQHIYGKRLYDTEQIQVEDIVTGLLERIYPGIQQDIEVIDVATPLSYERFTGNWLGSSCGWLLTKETMNMMIMGIDKTLPGLKNFYMCGQWVEPGGSVPVVAMSGRQVAQLLCHTDKRPFLY